MSTSSSTYVGPYEVWVDWGEYVSGDRLAYAPKIVARSSSSLADSSIPYTWELLLDGSTVDSGSGTATYYNSNAGVTGRGPYVVDTYQTRYVSLVYGETQTLRLWQRFTNWFAGNGQHLTITIDKTLTVPARAYDVPSSPSGLAATLRSDGNIELSWTNNSTGGAGTSAPYQNVAVERKDGGGDYAQVALLDGSSTGYIDEAAQADSSYTYRVRAYNSSGYSPYSGEALIYTVPVAPGTPSASKQGDTTAAVTWSNNSSIAQSVVVQRSVDGGATWTVYAVSNSLSSFTDTSATGFSTISYRVANQTPEVGGVRRTSEYSAASNEIIALAPPNAPTVLTQANQPCAAGGNVTLAWRHNPVDGTAQRKYQIAVGTDPNNMSERTAVTSASETASVSMSGYSLGATVYWKVRTWGLHDDPSAWSGVGSVKIVSPVSVAITTPATDPYSLTGLPLVVEWSYSDSSNAQAGATVKIMSGAVVVASQSVTGTGNSLTLGSWQPDNLTSYRLVVEVKSSSTLTASDELTINVNYQAPATPSASVIEGEGGSAVITVEQGEASGSELPTESLSLSRVVDGVETVLATEIPSGSTVIDRIPQFDIDIKYRVYALSSQNLTSKKDVTFNIPSRGRFVWNYGQGNASFAQIQGNVSISSQYEDDSELWYGAGAKDPIMLSGTRKAKSITVTGNAFGYDMVKGFETFADTWHRPCIFRGPNGRIEKVRVEVSENNAHDKAATFTVNMKRLA